MGVKQVYPGRYLPDTLLTLIQRERVTFSHCVPTILHMMLTSPASRNIDLSGWKVVIGGSALPKGLAKMAMDKGVDIFGGYGMSETCPIVSLAQLKPSMTELDADEQLEYRTRAGIPGQLVDLRIVDDEMQDVPHDGKSSGEVVVRAPWLTQGYLNDPINSENLWRGQSGVSSQNGQCQKFVLWITWRRPVLVSSTRRSCARSTASTLRMCSINRLPVPQTGFSTKQGQQHIASALPQTKIALLKKRGKRQHHDGEEKNDEEEVGPRPDREAHHRGNVGGLYEGNHNA